MIELNVEILRLSNFDIMFDDEFFFDCFEEKIFVIEEKFGFGIVKDW